MKKIVIVVFLVIFIMPWLMSFAESDAKKSELTKDTTSIVENSSNASILHEEIKQKVINENIEYLRATQPLLMIVLSIFITIFICLVVMTGIDGHDESLRMLCSLIAFVVIVMFIACTVMSVDKISVDNKLILSGDVLHGAIFSYASMLLFFVPGVIYISESRRGTLRLDRKTYFAVVLLSVFSLLTTIASVLLTLSI